MVAFIKDGMDIPDHLVHAQENGRVVFFCGAGISMPAGLPSFKKLVDLIYSELNISKEGSEVDYYHEERFDWVLGLLERRLIGGRMQVRKPLMDILQPESDSPGTTATHKALLQLATYQDRAQLVTTNFDQIFAKVIREQNLSIPEFQAPHMPESTSGQWGGLVYLHGLLPESYNASKLEHLVLTSGDFGSAYLTRQWAANFVNALLQNYIVCFVGYSLGDHLLQYLLTAPAHGESRHNVYAFADLDGDKQKEYERWRAKGVTPVFYNPGKDHAPLHHTLEAWAKIYSASTEGKKKIITEHAGVAPPSSSRSDYVVGRVLWALTDPVAAKHFREMKPVPPLEWLDPLLENSFGREDLPNFGITADSAGQSDEKFSFLRRPTPIAQVPLMSLFTTDKDYHRIGWDNTMRNFADWICRHLGDPNILRRIAKNGYELHDNFLSAINWAMYEIKMLESKKDAEGLARLADGASHAIPCKNMRVLWQLILSGKIKLSSDELDFRSFLDCVEKNGWTAMSRLEMRKMLTPYIKLDPPRFGESADASASSLKIADIVDCKIVLAGRGIHRSLDRHAENSAWNTALPDLLPDFTALLRDALDLVHIVGQANDSRDMSVDCQPSISPSLQIHRPSGWTALVHLSRNAWIAASESNPEKARSVAEQWMHEQYPPFKKLALFAATHAVISDEQALNWLLFENCRWLWADATRHEMSRLIVARAPQLPKNLLRKLESAIANGPPRDMFPEDLGVADFSERAEQIILFRLAKLQASGSVLGHKAADMLQKLQAKHPRIQLHKDALDEFYFRPIGVRFRQEPPLPTQQHELVDLIKNYHEHSTPVGNRWRAYCSDESPKALSVLQELANKNEWPKAEWRDALGAWARNEDFLNTSFSTVCDLLANAPNEMMQSPGGEFTFWMWEAAATVDDADERILALSDRIIRTQHSEYAELEHDSLVRAHDHPVGGVVEALMELFRRHAGNKGKETTAKILEIFSRICNTQNDQFRYGRVVLAAYTPELHYSESEWTEKHLLPLFDWEKSEQEAQAVWSGCLSRHVPFREQLLGKRLFDDPLLLELKDAIRQTAKNCGKLRPDHTDNYADLLTFTALNSPGVFSEEESALSKEDLRDYTAELPPKALERVPFILYLRLNGAGENHSECWKNQVRPYLEYIWPKSEGNRKTQKVSSNLAELCTAAGEFFPEAWDLVGDWLQNLKHTRMLLGHLCKKDICKNSPKESRKFLSKIIGNDSFYNRRELQACLDDIKGADPDAPNDPDFQDLERRCN